jgi:hypothetical protein
MPAQRRHFHITPASNLHSILTQGLLPRIGPRSRALGEPRPAVYLFDTADEAADAVSSWLGDVLPADEPLALIAVTLDPAFPLTTGVEWERIALLPIPPHALAVLATDF